MKLYLSSYKLGNDPQKLVDLVGDNKKTAVITNALDFSTDMVRKDEGTKKEIESLNNLGFESEEVDLRKYFGKPKELKKKLSHFGLFFVKGGNAFILRRAFKQSGMDKWLISQKANKDLVYAGYSAGVCVLSPSLKGLEIVDNPDVSAEGYSKEIIWDGLGLINFAFAPHYKSDHPESAAVDKEVEYYKSKGIPFKALHDGEVIVLEI